MRAEPGPVAQLLPSSAHAIEREFAVMSSLQGADVPVPHACAVRRQIGDRPRLLRVMECVQGRVLWDRSLPV